MSHIEVASSSRRSGPATSLPRLATTVGLGALAVVLTGCLFGGEPELPFDEDEAVMGTQVAIENNTYTPGAIAVGRNRAVRFDNLDHLRHTVVSGSPGHENGLFDEVIDEDGGSAAVAFSDAGVYPYFCRLHPGMRGMVVVG